MTWRFVQWSLLGGLSLAIQAEEQVLGQTCNEPPDYQITRHGIFDPSHPDHTWLHHWADHLHLTTKAVTIESAIAAFPPCDDSLDDLYELERYLRHRPYLRDAKVQSQRLASGKKVIEVQTWDTWSLLPSVNFSRSGGENSSSVGFRDSNFLGLGVDTKLLYFSDHEREGYQFDLHTPLFLKQYITLDLKFTDSDDGQQTHIGLQRPFLNKSSQQAWGGFYRDAEFVGYVRQGNGEINQFRNQERAGQLWYGWSNGHRAGSVWRYQFGVNYSKNQFISQQETYLLPSQRQRTAFWLRARYYQDKFSKRRNVFLINQIEDINLGLDVSMSLGWDVKTEGLVAQWQMEYGLEAQPNLVWLHQANIETERREDQSHYWFGRWRQEWFYHYREPLRFYAKLDVAGSANQYLDKPLTLGAENNLRGYPLQYQHGDWHWLTSIEGRYYPNINLMQIAELGAAVFYDVGRSYGDSPYPNNPLGTLQSIGVGLRFYLSRAGSSNVAHFDFVRPLSDDPRVNSWEWRAQVKKHF